MIKYLGAGMIILSCGFIGLSLGRNYAKRVVQLQQIQYGLEILETEISYVNTCLPDAMDKISRHLAGPVKNIYQITGHEIRSGNGITPSQAWAKALDKGRDYLALISSDLDTLSQFGQGLGCSDKEDQLKKIALTRQRLSQNEKTAQAEMYRLQKVWQNLGWAVGIVITLLML